MISQEKWMMLTPLQKLPKNGRRFGQINCCQRPWKIAQSRINCPIRSHCAQQILTFISYFIKLSHCKQFWQRAGAHVRWLWETTHVRQVMGSNPGCILNGHDIFTRICWKHCIDVCLEKTESKQKRGRVGPFKKQFWQNVCTTSSVPKQNKWIIMLVGNLLKILR